MNEIWAEGGTFTWEAEPKPYLMTAEERAAVTSCGSSEQHKAAVEGINEQGTLRMHMLLRVIPKVPSPQHNVTLEEIAAIEQRCETQPGFCGAC